MPKGSCMCGDYTHEFSGEPLGVAVCHCIPCHKNAGLTGSTNVLIKTDQYKKTSGEIRNWQRTGDSGKVVKYNNCATCGTIMTVDAEVMPGMLILKNGTLDDPSAIEQLKPGSSIYNKNRPNWCDGLMYAEQKDSA